MKPFENFLYFTGIICCCWWLEHETNEEIELDEFIYLLWKEKTFPKIDPARLMGFFLILDEKGFLTASHHTEKRYGWTIRRNLIREQFFLFVLQTQNPKKLKPQCQ
jgi:hypothetical protein